MAEVYTLSKHNDLLILALSDNPTGMAAALHARGLIPSNIREEILFSDTSPKEKATKLIAAVRNRVKIDPKMYHEFMDVLKNEFYYYQDIVKLLNSTYQDYTGSKSYLTVNVPFVITHTCSPVGAGLPGISGYMHVHICISQAWLGQGGQINSDYTSAACCPTLDISLKSTPEMISESLNPKFS